MGPLVRSIVEPKPSSRPPTITSLLPTRCGLLPRNSHRQLARNSINSPEPAGQTPDFLLLSSPSSKHSFRMSTTTRTVITHFPNSSPKTDLISDSTKKFAKTFSKVESGLPKTAYLRPLLSRMSHLQTSLISPNQISRKISRLVNKHSQMGKSVSSRSPPGPDHAGPREREFARHSTPSFVLATAIVPLSKPT